MKAICRPHVFYTPIPRTICMLLMVGSSFAHAASNDIDMDEVIVKAFRLPSQVSETGSSIWIVDKTLIDARGYKHMTDVLATAPGVTVNQNGAFGGQANARIRGASSDQTLVLIDGVVGNDTSTPGGGFDFGVFDVTDIERVEVLKGPQSTLWGSDAIGGVINVISRKPEAGFNADVNAGLGSFGAQQYGVSVDGSNSTGDFRLSYNDQSTDGISKADEADGNSEDDGYENQTLSLKGALNLPGNARLEFNYRDTETTTEFDSFGVATGIEDGSEVSDVEFSSAQLSLKFPLFDDRLQNRATYADTQIDRANISAGVPSFSAEGSREVFQYQGTYAFNELHQLSVGFEDEETGNGTETFSNTGIFALYQLRPSDDLTVSLGLRDDDHDEYGSKTVARVSAAWSLTDMVNLRASWGEGFKAPTIFQTTFFCCGAVSANPDLKAEDSEAYDLGVDWQFANGNAALSLTAFSQDTENQISFSFAVGGYENIAEVESRGIELALDYRFTEVLTATANFTRMNSEDGNGTQLIRLPELTADVAVNWQILPAVTTSLVAIHNSDEEDSRGTVDSWTRFDLSAVFRPSDNISISARMENLSDKDYQQIFGYGTPGRSGYVGVTYSF